MTHWMNQAVRRAGLPCADRLDLPEGLDIGEVWTRTMEVCDVSADRVAEAVARAFHLETIAVSDAEPTAARLLPEAVARRHRAIPVRDMNRSLVVAVSDPSDPEMEQDIRFASGRIPELRVAPPALVKDALDRIYGEEATVESFLSGVSADGVAEVELAEDEGPERVDPAEAGAGPVVNLVNMILDEAVQTRASDIHLQPGESKGLVRFRIDGVLRTTARVPHSVLSRVISRIKVMGNLDIADRLRAQDGRVRVRIRERSFDLRISTVPTRKAEKAVVRILDPGASTTLEEVGIPGHDLEQVRSVLRRRDGVFVVTGPTGSGKTTTLYSALREIDTEDVNIMTVEDPVEYELPGLTQIQVEQSQGMTFASALRAILRQDPDVIFVGEIRDAETAEIAAQASLTGHLVLATLHTNDALGTLRRFTDLGLDPGTVAETLRGALAQRLVRRVCGHCRSRVREARTDREEDLAEFFGVAPTVRAVGCAQCSGRGYLGRIPVTEYMRVTPDLVRLLLQGASPPDLLAQARRDGLRTLRESALDRVRAGETTLEEVARVVGEEDEESGSLPPAPPPEPPTAARLELREDRLATSDVGELPRALLVDDDAETRGVARKLLTQEGFSVVEATGGSEALAMLTGGARFDLLVLDLEMPMLGGREVLKALRGAVATVSLPVVVLTSSDDPSLELEILEKGADDYLRKPLDPERFLLRVNAVLRRRIRPADRG